MKLLSLSWKPTAARSSFLILVALLLACSLLARNAAAQDEPDPGYDEGPTEGCALSSSLSATQARAASWAQTGKTRVRAGKTRSQLRARTTCAASWTTRWYKGAGIDDTPWDPIAGYRRRNVANWMYARDCGGWQDNACSIGGWEANRYGDRFGGSVFGRTGQGWTGVDHYGSWFYGHPYCTVHTSTRAPYTKCYQVSVD